MTDNSRRSYGITVAVTIVVVLLAGPVSRAYAKNPELGVIPPHASPHGMTYGEWSAKWWQWALSLPADQHPLNDSEGVDCSEGQTGKAWFLGGSFESTPTGDGGAEVVANRECTVPVGTALFFPIVNAECSEIEGNGSSDQELRDCANDLADHIQGLSVTIDGVEVEHLGLYRAESPLFNIAPLPDPNVLVPEAGATGPSVADGFYIMLAPLSRGDHDIHFGGTAVFTEDPDGFDFVFEVDVSYHMTVVPRSPH